MVLSTILCIDLTSFPCIITEEKLLPLPCACVEPAFNVDFVDYSETH